MLPGPVFHAYACHFTVSGLAPGSLNVSSRMTGNPYSSVRPLNALGSKQQQQRHLVNRCDEKPLETANVDRHYNSRRSQSCLAFSVRKDRCPLLMLSLLMIMMTITMHGCEHLLLKSKQQLSGCGTAAAVSHRNKNPPFNQSTSFTMQSLYCCACCRMQITSTFSFTFAY